MLQELSIRNFALIEELHLTFPAGLNLITGETGAGKSIVIDALGLILGERASGQEVIRTGADRCVVEAVFDIADAPSTRAYLAAQELSDDADGAVLTVSRELTRAGKNLCRINGRLAQVSTLRDATDGLVDVHGQHEHQTLLNADRHVDLLDGWLGPAALSLRSEVVRLHRESVEFERELHRIRSSAKERARNLDLFRFQRDEIESAALLEGEDTQLADERARLMNADKLRTVAEDAYAALSDSALDGLNTALSQVQRGAGIDSRLEPALQLLNDAVSSADEARRALRVYRDAADSDPERLEQIEERLETIRALKRKYGDTVAEIAEFCARLCVDIGEIELEDNRSGEIEARLAASVDEALRLSRSLSEVRRAGSEKFARSMLSELQDLGMAQCRFEVRQEERPVGATGLDRIEFLISPNPGEPLKPLAKIASGGELSRIMLSFKTVLAQTAYVPTLVFDEIDIGVGGRTASAIARKIASLAKTCQVFCITHLPQIASQPAAAHFFIDKRTASGRTVVHIAALDAEGRVEEVARMLGGAANTKTVVQHAREMLASGTVGS